jgi:hypothetical protein
MTRCISCGAAIYEDEVGCSACWAQARAEREIDTERPPAMRRANMLARAFVAGLAFVAVLLLVAAHLMSGCAVIQKAWPGFVTCVTHSGHPVDEVSMVLQRDGSATELSAESKQQLEKLAATWGADVIACIIEQLIEAWVPEGPALADPGRLAAARRGQDFLNLKQSHPVMQE